MDLIISFFSLFPVHYPPLDLNRNLASYSAKVLAVKLTNPAAKLRSEE